MLLILETRVVTHHDRDASRMNPTLSKGWELSPEGIDQVQASPKGEAAWLIPPGEP
jgi:hypothetical protein